jgi:hypothetical protein
MQEESTSEQQRIKMQQLGVLQGITDVLAKLASTAHEGSAP